MVPKMITFTTKKCMSELFLFFQLGRNEFSGYSLEGSSESLKIIPTLWLTRGINVLCSNPQLLLPYTKGGTTAQTAGRQLPTMATRVRVQVRSCGICGGLSDTGTGFLRVLRFPLPIFNPPTAPHSSSSGAGTTGQTVVEVPSGLSLTPSQETKKEKNTLYIHTQ
jgi:hypothetical protein